MDLARPSRQKQRTRRRIAYAAGAAAVLALVTLGLSRLKPAEPPVDRSLVVIETVRRGALLRQVRGTGSLVPVEVNWIAPAMSCRPAKPISPASATDCRARS